MPKTPEFYVNAPEEKGEKNAAPKKPKYRAKQERKGPKPLEQRKKEVFEKQRSQIEHLLEEGEFFKLEGYLEAEKIGKSEFKGRLRPLVGQMLQRYINDGNLYNIRGLQIATGINFDLKPLEHSVQMAYAKILQRETGFALDSINQFYTMYGIEPDYQGRLEPAVQEYYAKTLQLNEHIPNNIIDQTGIKPDYHGRLYEAVQHIFANKIKAALLLGFLPAYNRIGDIPPDWNGRLKSVAVEAEWGYVTRLDEFHFKQIVQESEIDISEEPEFTERIREAQEEWVNRTGLITCPAFMGISPDYHGSLRPAVQRTYKQAMERSPLDVYAITSIRKLTGVPPDMDEPLREIIHNAYVKYAQSNSLEAIRNLAHATDVEPDWNGNLRPAVIKNYRGQILAGHASNIDYIVQITGVRADYEGELRTSIIESQKKAIRTCDFLTLRHLSTATRVRPEVETVLLPTIRSTFKKLLKKGDLQNVSDLSLVVGVEPDWSGELEKDVHERYAACLDGRDIPGVLLLMNLSGIQPDFERLKEHVQKAYGSTIKHGRLNNLRALERESGISPDYENLRPQIHKAYKRWVARGTFKPVEALHALSGIEPDYASMGDQIQNVYVRHLQRDQLDRLRNMQAKTGIPADFNGTLRWHVVENYVGKLHLLQGENTSDLEKVEELQQLTGIPVWASDVCERLSDMPRSTALALILKKFRDNPEAIKNIKEGAQKGMKTALTSKRYAHVEWQIKSFDVMPERADLMDALTRELATGYLPPDLLQIFNRCNTRFELNPEQFEQLNLSDPRTAAIVIKFGIPKEANARKQILNFLDSKGGWLAAVPELINTCGPAARPEFCPWEQRLKPMFVGENLRFNFFGMPLEQTAPLNLNDTVRRRGFINFVKRFGAVRAPLLANAVMDMEAIYDELASYPRGTEARAEETNGGEEPPRFDGLRIPSALAEFLGEKEKTIKTTEEADTIMRTLEWTLASMRKNVLNDELPEGIDSALGMELFNAIVPRGSNYGDMNDRQSLIAQWSATVDEARVGGHIKETQVPDGYTKRTYRMRRIDTNESSLEDLFEQLESSEQNEEAIAKQSELLGALQKRLEETDKQEAPLAFLAPFIQAVEARLEHAKDFRMLPARTFQGFVQRLEDEIEVKREQMNEADPEREGKKRAGIARAIEQMQRRLAHARELRREDGYLAILNQEAKRLEREATERSADIERSLADERDERKRKSKQLAHEGWLKEQEGRISSLNALQEADPLHDRYPKIQGILEALRISFGKNVLSAAGKEARELALALIAIESPDHIEAIRNAQTNDAKRITPDVREAWSKLIEDELLLHFTDPEHPHAETRRIPFTPELFTLIESMWRTTKIRKPLIEEIDHFARKGTGTPKPPKHPFMDAVFKARGIEREIERVKNPKKVKDEERAQEGTPVTCYPVHGLGRILSGDIANACFDKQRQPLSKNKFPKLNAVLMGAHEGEDVRIIGSFLLIESSVVKPAEQAGERVLVIRATNPTEAGNREFRAEDYVERTIEYAKDTAHARGINQIVLCYEEFRGGHASNVIETITAMKKLNKKYNWPNGPTLENTPEMEFNGYQVWRPSETKVVWRMPEKTA